MTADVRKDISVVVPAWNSKRWGELSICLRAIAAQTLAPLEVIAVIDHNPDLLRRVETEFPAVQAVANSYEQGVVGARNTGIELATGEIVVLTDDDTRAAPDWLEKLRLCFDEDDVVGVTGELLPEWAGKPARWFPFEFYWVFGCSYAGLPKTLSPVRNPIAANMAVRRWAVQEVGGFRQGVKPQQLLHRGAVVAGGHALEDTELGIRIGRRWPEMKWLYQPDATVMHRVDQEQSTLGYLLRRSYEEGGAKATLARSMGSDNALESERRHLLKVIPAGFLGGFAAPFRGNPWGPASSLAILLGIVAAGAGYLRALLAERATPGTNRA
jgi:glycosyltransferase involved in cell wall biosynthesis